MPRNSNKQIESVMSTKTKPAPTSASGDAAPSDTPTFRTNPQVDAKIDAYIKENPKYWTYVQAMPRERLERTVVLNEVRELDRAALELQGPARLDGLDADERRTIGHGGGEGEKGE